MVLLGAVLLAPLVRAQTLPRVPRYSKFEASWTLPGQAGNPFDPADNDVQAVFTTPGGGRVTVPAFWDGDRWRVRYAPTRTGVYALSVQRSGQPVSPPDLRPQGFRCVPSRSFGFVRRDPRGPQRFVFDNGRAYYPLGMDAAWQNGPKQSYPATFAAMGRAHMNWARVWMNHWDGKNLEWASSKADNPKIGTYSLAAARRWDMILDQAEKSGVFVQMTLQHHGPYTEKTDPNWQDNPFNAANGGFLQHPDDFFTDTQARRLTRNKYRYITARWGYSTHLLSYELFNEVQNITEARSHFADVVAWHKEMAAALRAEDANHHLITTSNSPPGDPLAQIGLDYDQVHTYVPDIISNFAALKPGGKPVFTGEWGPSDAKADMTEGFLHDGLWASLMAPTAGAGQFWYWDVVIDHGWWPQFASAAGFLQAFSAADLRGLAALSPGVTAPGAYSDLSFAPSGGWEKFTRDTVTLPAGGAALDLSGLSSFFQGEGHRDMMPRPITFLVNCPAACRFVVTPGDISKVGARPTLSVDGKVAAAQDFPAAPENHPATQTLAADLTPGPHRVALSNPGPDWFTVRRLTVTRYAPPVAVLAKGNRRAAVFWAYARDRRGRSLSSATLKLSGLASGPCRVRLWDPWQGREIAPGRAVRRGGAVEVALPPMARDLAGIVTVN